MVTKHIRRGDKFYKMERADGWFILLETRPAKRFVGNFKSKETMFEWLNEVDRIKQHPSLRIRVPKEVSHG